MAKDKKYKYRLTELSGSDFEIADGEQDIRGWKVKNGNGTTIGEVVELLFDPLSRSVRYLIVHIEGKPLNLISRKVLIPIGLADIHETEDVVIVPNITMGHLATLPVYKKGSITPGVEKNIRTVLSGGEISAYDETEEEETEADERFYDHEHFDEDRIYQRRRNKKLKEEDIPVVEEEVHTAKGKRIVHRSDRDDRQDIKEQKIRRDESTTSKPFEPFREGTVEFTEKKEVPVVTKTPRVVEEISVKKDAGYRDETIKDRVRRTEIDVEEYDEHGNKK